MQGGEVKDPIRRGLGNAIQWYDCLRTTVNDFEDDLISKGAKLARSMISLAGPSRGMPITATANREQDSWDAVPVHPEDAQSVQPVRNAIIESQTYPDNTENNRCSRLLRGRCPACFGGEVDFKQDIPTTP